MQRQKVVQRRVRLRFLLLLWTWVGCMVALYHMCADVPEFDRIRPSAEWYREARENAHRALGTRKA